MAHSIFPGDIFPKRSRIGSDSSSPEPVNVRHAELWFADGSIILRAASPVPHDAIIPTRLLYKVHKFVLAAHAVFFAELFSGETSALDSASEQYDGVPVMDMPDPAKDVEIFLRAVYFHSRIAQYANTAKQAGIPTCFPDEYAALLRLSKKYGAEELQKEMVDVFQSVWPSSYTTWIVRQAGSSMHPSHPDPASALRLATDCDIPQALPVIYYDLCRVYSQFTTEGRPCRQADLSLLTSNELARLLEGMGRLRQGVSNCFSSDASRHFQQMWFFPPGEYQRCENPSRCRATLSELWANHIEPRIGKDDHDSAFRDVLEYFSSLYGRISSEFLQSTALCGVCQTRSAGHWISKQQSSLWRALPGYFGLSELVPTWGTGFL